MATQALTLQLPERLYDRLTARAAQAHRSVEAEAVEALAAALPADDTLPEELATLLESLHLLDDSSLRQAAQSQLTHEFATELEALHHKAQREGLTMQEAQTVDTLTRQYERVMLVRAEATRLLHGRGQDVTGLAIPR